jgi:hypothetical protein
MSYCIIKVMKNEHGGKPIHSVIIDNLSEVMEFNTPEEAEKIRSLFAKNSDSGHEYYVKKIGSKLN